MTAAVLIAAFSHVVVAAPSPSRHDLLVDTSLSESAEAPTTAKPGAVIVGEVDAQTLSGDHIDVALPDGIQATAQLRRIVRDRANSRVSWIGEFRDARGSYLLITSNRGAVTGIAQYAGRTFELRPARKHGHVLFEIDSRRIPPTDGVWHFGSPDLAASTNANVGEASSTTDSGTSTTAVTQDLLVVYTANAAGAWGKSALESMVINAVQAANQAYQNSNVHVVLNVVGLQQVALAESNGTQATLTALAQNSAVRSLRDSVAADMVVLVDENSDYCGWAGLGDANGTTDAYAVVWSHCLSSQSLAHEVGHLQGLDHNRENSGSNGGFYPYGYGYRICVSGGFRDIMSYDCASVSVPRVLQFSNPNVYYNGYVTGISYESSPSTAADTARALNNSAAQVANYRVGSAAPSPSAPAAPTSVVAKNGANSTAIVSWVDASSTETKFEIRRSKWNAITRTWSSGTIVASVSANVVRYVDPCGAGKFRYRVRARNASGASAYAGPAIVTVTEK